MDDEEQRYADAESRYMTTQSADTRETCLYAMVESLSRQVASLKVALREEIWLRLEDRTATP